MNFGVLLFGLFLFNIPAVIQQSMDIAGREARKDSRKRGGARRVVDLDDLVLDLPFVGKAYDNDEEKDDEIEELDEEDEDEEVEEEEEEEDLVQKVQLEQKHRRRNSIPILKPPILPPSHILSHAEDRINDQHKAIVAQRLKQRQLERSKAMAKSNPKSKSKSKSNRSTISKFKSIKIKYRRIPSNKTKLIYIDVISQMLKDYMRDNRVIKKFIDKIVDLKQSEVKIRRNTKNKNKINAIEREVFENVKIIIKDYYERIDEYFANLIDLYLSNNLIKNDLEKINIEKNKLRLQIFDVRQERSLVDLELKEIRNEFKDLNCEFSNKTKIYKQIIALKEGSELLLDNNNLTDENSLINDINWKLNKLDNNLNSIELLNTLTKANLILEKENTK